MSWRSTLPARLRASGIHFLLSFLVFLGLLYFILYRWYPTPFFGTDGGWQGVKIMIGVDLVLGPLLTFLIFNPGKTRRLIAIDLGVITLIQVSAIIWGVYAVHSQRPVAIVHWDNSFHSVKAEELYKQDVDLDELRKFSSALPPLIYARIPASEAEIVSAVSLGIGKGVSEWAQFHLYSPLKDNLEKISARALNIEQVTTEKPGLMLQLEQFLSDKNRRIEDYIYVRFHGSYKSAILILDQQGTIAGSLVEQN